MAETVRPSTVDMMPVRSRVSWGAIAAGAMVFVAVYLLLTLLGVAVGLEVSARQDVDLKTGAALWSILTLLLAMFLGGWSTSRLAVGETKLEAVLYGVILWGALFIGMLWLFANGVRIGFGAMMGVASGATSVAAAEDQSGGASNAGVNDTNFVEELKKLGVDEGRAQDIQKMVNERTSQLGQLSGEDVRQGSRKAVWYSLLGIVVSMAAVILGSLIGSGDIPIPITMLGVRRVPPPQP